PQRASAGLFDRDTCIISVMTTSSLLFFAVIQLVIRGPVLATADQNVLLEKYCLLYSNSQL
ncbi:TPA: hypothetical protein ACWXKZ_005656, partial [Escherichia coli]